MHYHIDMITHGRPLVNQLSALVGQVDNILIASDHGDSEYIIMPVAIVVLVDSIMSLINWFAVLLQALHHLFMSSLEFLP